MKIDSNIISRIPTVTWYVPEERLFSLEKAFKISDPASINLLSLALTRKSLLKNKKILPNDYLQKMHQTLNFLGSIGSDIIELSSKYVLYAKNNDISKGNLYNWSQSLKHKMLFELQSKLQVEEFNSAPKGEETHGGKSFRKGESVVYQVISALVLIKGLGEILEMFCKELFKEEEYENLERVSSLSPKQILQEYTNQKYRTLPSYHLLRQSYPKGQPEFVVEVKVGKKRVQAAGPSKKGAQKEAAKNYLMKYASHFFKEHASKHAKKSEKTVRTSQRIPCDHSMGIEIVAKTFELSTKGKLLISRSLVQKSYVNEHLNENILSYSDSLSQIGSDLLNVISGIFFFKKIISEDIKSIYGNNIRLFCVFTQQNIIDLFKWLNVEHLILRSRGESKREFTDATKIRTTKAILASIFIDRGHLNFSIFSKWLEAILVQFSKSKNPIVDQKGYLLQYFQAVGKLEWNYENERCGPLHDRKFSSSIIIRSNVLKEEVRYVDRKFFRDKKSSDSHVSNMLSSTLDVLNGSDVNSGFCCNNLIKKSNCIIDFFLKHLIRVVPETEQSANRWINQRLFGTGLLLEKRYVAFMQWLSEINSAYKRLKTNNIYFQKNVLLDFYKLVGKLQRQNRLLDIEKHFQEYLNGISFFLEKIDLEQFGIDLRDVQEFKKILILTQVSKLSSQTFEISYFKSIFEDFILLNRSRLSHLNYIMRIPENVYVIEIHSGTIQALLDQLWNAIDQKRNSKDSQEINITITFDNTIQRIFFKFEAENADFEKSLRIFDDKLFRIFMEDYMSDLKYEIKNNNLFLSFPGFEMSSDKKLAHYECLRTYLKEFSAVSKIHYAISRISHDLKNQLLAFQVCMNSTFENESSRLKNKYNASLHLDSARKLCEAAKSISSSLSKPEIKDVDINQLIKEFIARKLLSLPLGVRISPPKTNELCKVRTSGQFLESILENITKNSIEAFEERGEIRIDWVYNEESQRVLIEIEDNGPGIDERTLQNVVSGNNYCSNKKEGSGIGMLTVKAMLDRICGTIAGESILGKGCKWSITFGNFIDDSEDNIISSI